MKKIVIYSAFLALSQYGFSADIIIESRAEGKNFDKYSEIAGNWISSNTPPQTAKSGAPDLTPQGTTGARRATADPTVTKKQPNQLVAAARFSPQLTEAGKHHVYFTYPKSANATPVVIVIKHAGGEEKQIVAQDGWNSLGSAQADKWVELGEYTFNPGADQYVEIQIFGDASAVNTAANGQVYADAVRFKDTPLENSVKPIKGIPGRAVDKEAVQATSAPAAATPDPTPINWTTLADARSRAAGENKKLFIFFHSSGGTRSSDYETKTLNTPEVKALLRSKFIPVKVNMETDASVAASLEVFRAGTISIFNASGIGLEKISDTPETAKLVEILNKL